MSTSIYLGKKIIHKVIIDGSSMDWAKEEFDSVLDGTVFIADTYGAARGRQGREWKLYPGQLSITFVLKFEDVNACKVNACKVNTLHYLNMAITNGIADVLKAYNVGVKWPNDFMFDSKKVGGMLLESVWIGGKVAGVIAGVSINCNNTISQDDDLYPIAISIKDFFGEVDLDDLFKTLLVSIDNWYCKWKAKDFDAIFSRWKDVLTCLGEEISVHCKSGIVMTGLAKDVTSNGNLILIDKDNCEWEIPFYAVDLTSRV